MIIMTILYELARNRSKARYVARRASQSVGMRISDILEIIMAHFALEGIPFHTLETPIREVLAWVVVLASMFTKIAS